MKHFGYTSGEESAPEGEKKKEGQGGTIKGCEEGAGREASSRSKNSSHVWRGGKKKNG